MPASATASYAPSSLASESYQKLPLSGASNYTAEPQEMPLQTSIPPVQLSMVANEQQPAIRTQYASYVTSAPPQLSIPTTAMGGSSENLSVPRYVDNNARPTKSPRHATHQSVHSNSSITNNDNSEYRYGPSYVPVNHNHPSEMSSSSYSTGDSGSAGGHHTQQPPARDYYPPTNSWTSTAGEPNATVQAYHNTESRPYAYPDHQYKTGHAMPPLKTDHPQGPTSYGGQPLSHYNWSPT